MPQSLSLVLVHIVFSTKNRKPVLTPAIERELHPYLASIFNACRCQALEVGGADDHVHILSSLTRTITIADLLETVKKSSSKWIKTKGPQFQWFHWQDGYGAFSIGRSGEAALRRYIVSQREHHKRITFLSKCVAQSVPRASRPPSSSRPASLPRAGGTPAVHLLTCTR
ncbi:MAG: IS200/IS605 family transposase [Planctomycetota bacterium]